MPTSIEMRRHASPRTAPTVLVTGVAGYIGSHFALACIEAGWRVVGIDTLEVGSRETVPPGVDFVQMDVADPALADLMSAKRIDVAAHFAALISVEESFARAADYHAANVGKTLRFLRSVDTAGLKGVVFSSTAAVYGEAGQLCVGETAPLAPMSPYGRSKLAAERVLSGWSARTSIPAVVLRYFNVAGADMDMRAGPRSEATHLIKIVAEAATGQRDSVTVNGTDLPTPDGTAVRDYVHVSDLAEAHMSAITHLLNGGTSQTFNVGYGRGYSVREVIDTALELAPVPFRVEHGPRRMGDIAYLVADPTAIKSRLRWTHSRHELVFILKTAIAWEQVYLAGQRSMTTTVAG